MSDWVPVFFRLDNGVNLVFTIFSSVPYLEIHRRVQGYKNMGSEEPTGRTP